MADEKKKPRVKIVTADDGEDEIVLDGPEAAMALKAVNQGALSVGADVPAWVAAAKMLRMQLAPKSNAREWAMFLYTCARIGVDPVARQAYLIPFNDKESGDTKHAMVVGIDGFRAKSKESGKYLGTVGPMWCGDDGVWKDIWVGREKGSDGVIKRIPPTAARVGIRIEGYPEPVWGTALYDEFVLLKKEGKEFTPRSMWAKSPANMLAKCAEAQAHRKANPHILGNVYISEELQHLSNPAEETRSRVIDAASVSPIVADALGESAKNQNPAESGSADAFIARMNQAGKGTEIEELRAIWREVPKAIKDAKLQEFIYETGFKPNRDAISRRTGDA